MQRPAGPQNFRAPASRLALQPQLHQGCARRRQRLQPCFAAAESTPSLQQKPAARRPPQSEQAQHQQEPGAGSNGAASPSAAADSRPSSSAVTVQYQREQAKKMRDFFRSQVVKKVEVQSQVFGWTPKNEITNGRWVMFGFGVGLLTEYATGVDFVNQLKLMVSYLGIADIYD